MPVATFSAWRTWPPMSLEHIRTYSNDVYIPSRCLQRQLLCAAHIFPTCAPKQGTDPVTLSKLLEYANASITHSDKCMALL